MSHLQNALTRRYNVSLRKWGRLLGNHYNAVLVEGGDRYHYQTLMDYIHLNPVRSRIIRPGEGHSVLDSPGATSRAVTRCRLGTREVVAGGAERGGQKLRRAGDEGGRAGEPSETGVILGHAGV